MKKYPFTSEGAIDGHERNDLFTNLTNRNEPQRKYQTPEYSVKEISDLIKNLIEDSFTYIKIRGEVSNFKLHSSGHMYFSLKDNDALINAVCFKNTVPNLKFVPEEGLEIVATGRITTYKQRSNYQILISQIEPAGLGSLMALFEKRKIDFEKAGLFKQEHKQEIPKFPKRIAVITSPTGAVIKDIMHRIEARYPTHIMLYPVLVQGKEAEIDIANAINSLNEISDPNLTPDTIILARGGGSFEDLWCFNEEIIVRTIFKSKIPIISAIGHETDFTLADFVADLRAPTPTAAAEIATPNKLELEQKISSLQKQLHSKINNIISTHEAFLNDLGNNLKRTPSIFHNLSSKLEQLNGRIHLAMKNKLQLLSHAEYNLQTKSLEQKLINKNNQVVNLTHRMNQKLTNQYEKLSDKQQNLTKLLESFSYKRTLERGFSVIRDKNDKIVKNIKIIKDSKHLFIEASDGKTKLDIKNSD